MERNSSVTLADPVDIGISKDRMQHILFWMHQFAQDWTIQGEVPMRIHESGMGQSFGLGSAPPFASEFMGYIGPLECKVPECAECADRRAKENNPYTKNHQSRTRTTRAFRKLRRFAPREFDAVYLAVVHRRSLAEIAEAFTDRSYSKGYDEVYDRAAILVLIVSGMHKLEMWW
jgi:hypothetical protein